MGLLSIDLNNHQANLLAQAINEPSMTDYFSMRFIEVVEAKITRRKLKQQRAENPHASQTDFPEALSQFSGTNWLEQSQGTIEKDFIQRFSRPSVFNSNPIQQLTNQNSQSGSQGSNLFKNVFQVKNNQVNLFNNTNTQLPSLDLWGKPIIDKPLPSPTWNEMFKPKFQLSQHLNKPITQRPEQQNPIFAKISLFENFSTKQENFRSLGDDALPLLNRKIKDFQPHLELTFDQIDTKREVITTQPKTSSLSQNTLQSQNELTNDQPRVQKQASPYLLESTEKISVDIRIDKKVDQMTRSKVSNQKESLLTNLLMNPCPYCQYATGQSKKITDDIIDKEEPRKISCTKRNVQKLREYQALKKAINSLTIQEPSDTQILINDTKIIEFKTKSIRKRKRK